MAAVKKTTRLTLPGDLHELEALAEPVGSSLFTTAHHDTPGHALAGAGVSLRRRLENGKSTWRLTLPGGQSLELPGGPAKPPARIRALLMALVRDLPLEPVATFRTRRSTLRVREEGADAADILADSVALMEGRRVATSFSEIEVAPLNGERAAVRRVVRRLIDQGRRSYAHCKAMTPGCAWGPTLKTSTVFAWPCAVLARSYEAPDRYSMSNGQTACAPSWAGWARPSAPCATSTCS